MKTIFTLLVSLLVSVSLMANDARGKSSVIIKSMDNADVRVVLDGKRFEPNGNALVISNIDAGRHTLKVYRQSRVGLFSIVGKRYELVYNSQLQFRGRTQMMLTIDRNGVVNVKETRVNGRDDRFNNRSNRDFDFGRDGVYGDYDRHVAPSMSDAAFQRMLSNIDREWLESNKMKSASQVLRTQNLSTDQVKEMMRLFRFENNRLEIAKQAYANVVDKWNYQEVNTLFSYSSSRTELDRYIRGQRW